MSAERISFIHGCSSAENHLCISVSRALLQPGRRRQSLTLVALIRDGLCFTFSPRSARSARARAMAIMPACTGPWYSRTHCALQNFRRLSGSALPHVRQVGGIGRCSEFPNRQRTARRPALVADGSNLTFGTHV